MKSPIARSIVLASCLLIAYGALQAQTTNAALKTPAVSSAPVILPIARKADAVLSVTPDRANWTYVVGEQASFKIRFDIKPYPASGLTIKYKLGPDNREGDEKTLVVPEAGVSLPAPLQSEPGFIRCIVKADIEGKPVTDSATVAFSPEKITPTQTDPADFDAYWDKQKAELTKIAPDYQLTPAPDLSNDAVEVFYLSFQNIGNWSGPSRMFGVLSVPRGAGSYPAVLNPPGAGVRSYSGNLGMAAKGLITLQIGIHGIPVNLPKDVYDNLGRGALNNYWTNGLDDKNTYYYRRVYLGVLRASEYLTTHPKWDGKNLIVSGGSQGGQLTIVTSVLNPKVSAIAPAYPAYSDVTGFYYGRTGGWPGLFKKNSEGKISESPVESKLVTTAYYDTVNFARRVKVPGFYSWGYNDPVTPPTSMFAAYNVITAPKQLSIAPEIGHKSSDEQAKLNTEWILKQVGISK
jgi:cephalosporin-C deacetylase